MGAIFVVALSLRLWNWSDLHRTPFFDKGLGLYDARYYDYYAKRIAGGQWTSDDVFFLAPLYQYTMAIPYALTGQGIDRPDPQLAAAHYDIAPAIYMQCVYGALSCCLLYWIGRRLFGHLAGAIAGLGGAFYGMLILFDGLPMTASLVVFVNLLLLLVLLRADEADRVRWWLAAGAMIGIAALAHGTALILGPLVAGVIALGIRRRGVARTCARWAALAGGAAITIAPATIHNWIAGHDLVLLTSNAGMNFYIGNNPTADGTWMGYRFPQTGMKVAHYLEGRRRGPDESKPSEASRDLRNQALAWMAGHPLDALRLFGRKAALFWNAVELGIFDQYNFFRRFSTVLRWPLPVFGIVAPLGLTGMICLIRRWRRLRMVYVVILGQFAAFTLMFILGRFRLVAAACLLLMAGGLIAWWVDLIRTRRLQPLALSITLAIVLIGLVHVQIGPFGCHYGWARIYAELGYEHFRRGDVDRAIADLTIANQLPWRDTAEVEHECNAAYSLGELLAARRDFTDAARAWQHTLACIERARQCLANEPMAAPEQFEALNALEAATHQLLERIGASPATASQP